MSYLFHTTCQDSDAVGEYGDDINEMIQSSHMIEIANGDFLKLAERLGIDDPVSHFGYDSKKSFNEDWGVSCHKSHFQGIEAFYVRHSGIEHIFVQLERINELLRGEEAEARRDAIEALDERLDEYEPWQNAESPKEQYQSLTQFVKDNLNEFKTNNILLASLFAYGHDYGNVVRRVDNENFFSKSTDNEITP